MQANQTPDEPSEPIGLSETLASGDPLSAPPGRPRARVGRYRVLRVLGQGGMGIVYAAFDDELSRPVAIKLVRGSGALGSSARARMRREAQAMAQLSHPNVVQIYDTGEHGGELFLAMELVHGRDLDEWLAELGAGPARAKQWREIVEVFVAAGRGLAAAHAAGLVHRDFKPSNVLVGEDVVKVGDFGLARGDDEVAEARERGPAELPAAALRERMTETGALLGTPAYLAPEQLVARESSVASDQFSYCVALWEALFGERPFAGEDFATLAANLLAGKRSAAPAGAGVPAWVIAVIERGLAPEPGQRWPSMDALLTALLDDPAKRRRRRLALGIGGVLLTLSAGAYAANEVQQQNACEAAAAAIDARWNDEGKQQFAGSFAATDAPDAAQSWARVEPKIDAWTLEWRDARKSACGQQRRDPERARQMIACLEHERWELEALFDVFAEADRGTVIEAVSAVGELPDVERCADPTWLAGDMSTQGADAAAGETVRRDLARVFALERANRHEDALALAQQSLEAARGLGDAVLEAEALAKLGGIRWRKSDFLEAEQDLLAAHFLASRVEHDRIAYVTARDLSWVVGVRLARPKEGRVWLEHARAYLLRSGGDPETEPDMFERLGELEDFEGHYVEALAAHERALALREQQFGPDHPAISESLLAIGQLHSTLGDERAAATLARAHQQAVMTLGAKHPTVAVVDNALGVLLNELGQIDESASAFREAIAIRERAFGPDDPGLAAMLMNLGLVLASGDDPLEALLLLERAVAILERSLGPMHGDTLSAKLGLAMMKGESGQVDDAIDDLRSLVAIDEVPDAPSRVVVMSYLATNLARRGDHAEALPLLRDIVALEEARLGAEHIELAPDIATMSRSEIAVGELEAALASARRSLAIHEAALASDDPALAAPLDGVALVLLAFGRDADALEYHGRAVALRGSPEGDAAQPLDLDGLRAKLAKLQGVAVANQP